MLDPSQVKAPQTFEALITQHCSFIAFLDKDAPSDPKLRNARVKRLNYYFDYGLAWAELERTRRMPEMPQKQDSNYPLAMVEPSDCLMNYTLQTGRAYGHMRARLDALR